MAVRRVAKEDLKRIARASGATIVMSLANLEGEETFEESNLGFAEAVTQEPVCDDELIIVHKPKAKSAASIILRGANIFMLDEVQLSHYSPTPLLPSFSIYNKFMLTCLLKVSV